MSIMFSLILAAAAWTIPILAMMPKRRKGGYLYVIGSLAACAFSIQLQLVQVVMDLNNDTVILDEKFDFLILSGSILVVGTFLLLGLSVYVKKKKS